MRKCIGAVHRKYTRYPPTQFLEVVSRLELPGLGVAKVFPKLQWECECGLGVRKCIGAVQEKYTRYPPAQFLEVVSCLESPGLGIALIIEEKQTHFMKSNIYLIHEDISMNAYFGCQLIPSLMNSHSLQIISMFLLPGEEELHRLHLGSHH